MTIFNTAYDTTVGKSFNVNKVVTILEELIIKNNFVLSNNVFKNYDLDQIEGYLLSNQFTEFSSVPLFNHPILIDQTKLGKERKEKLLVTDVRSFASVDLNKGDYILIPRNKMEFNLIKMRTALNMGWVQRAGTLNQRDLSFLPAAIYSSWISESLSRRFALDPKDQLHLCIISCIFYYSLFTEDKVFSDLEKMRIIAVTARATRASPKDVSDIVDQIEELSTIKDFVNAVKNILQNTRLQDFNEGILVSIVGSSWFGINAKEMLAVALEHPPTWIAIVYSAFTERSYHNSSIAKIAERYALNKGGNDFTKALISYIDEFLE